MAFFFSRFDPAGPRIRAWVGILAICVGVLPFLTAVADQTQDAKLIRPNGSNLELFGLAVALDGNRLLVSAPRTDTVLQKYGAVFLYDVSDPANPVLLSELTRAVNISGDLFGITLAISGDLALVGASGQGGRVYLFDISDPQNPVETLIPPPAGAGGNFGGKVDLDGNLAVIAGAFAGTYLFDVTNPAAPVQKSLIGDRGSRDDALAVGNDWLVIGDQRDASLGSPWQLNPHGAAYVFDVSDPENPIERWKILPVDPVWEGKFGSAAAINGDVIFIGEAGFELGIPPYLSLRRGGVSVFDVSGPGAPVWKSRITPSPFGYLKAGESIDLAGDELLIGGSRGGMVVGRAFLYDVSDPAAPFEKTRFSPSDIADALGFGISVAFNGSVAAVGAPDDSETASGGAFGSANVFGLVRVSVPDLEGASDTGASYSDDLTMDNTPTFEGTALNNTAVELLSDLDGAIGTGTADGNGDWSIETSTLSDGVHQIRATDGDGFFTDPLIVTIDTVAPPTPTGLDLAVASDTGVSNSDHVTRVTQPAFTGNIENGNRVILISDRMGIVTSPFADSPFSVTPFAPLDEGEHSMTVKARDRAGNDSAATGPVVVTIDSVAPTVTSNQATAQADPTNSVPISFEVGFSEPVFNFAENNIALSGTAGATAKALTELSPNDGTTYRLDVSSPQGDGTVIASMAAGGAEDLAGNSSLASTSTDNSVLFDAEIPSVTIDRAATQGDSANQSPIRFQVTFSETVTGFEPGDVSVGGTAGATSVAISGSGPVYEVAVGGMNGDGTVSISIGADVVQDAVGQGNLAAVTLDNEVNFDTTLPTVAINQAAAQADPTNVSPVNFTVLFSEAITGFNVGDIQLSGRANASVVGITELPPNDSTTFSVAVSGMARDGAVVASIGAGAISDSAGNGNTASVSADNQVIYDLAPPSVMVRKAATQSDPTSSGTIRFRAEFSEPVNGFGDADVSISGTAGATTATVSELPPNDRTVFNLAVSGMTGEGSVVVDIGAGVAADAAGKPNLASTSSDNTVEYDTHGGTRATATALIFSGGNAAASGSLEGADLDFFRFDLSEALHLSIFTEGSLDTVGRLFDSNDGLLNSPAADDGRGSGDNFRIEIPLAPGTYYVEVSGKGGSQSGAYQLHIEQGAAVRVQPDNRIGKSPTRSIGDDIYEGQQMAALVSKKGRAVRGYLGIENDGEVSDGFSVAGTRGTRIFKVTYTAAGGNVTSGITTGQYLTDAAVPGDDPDWVTVSIRPKRSRLKKIVGSRKRKRVKWLKRRLTIQLTSSSLIDGSVADSVRLRVKTK